MGIWAGVKRLGVLCMGEQVVMTNEVSVTGKALTWQGKWKEGAMGSKWGLWLSLSGLQASGGGCRGQDWMDSVL